MSTKLSIDGDIIYNSFDDHVNLEMIIENEYVIDQAIESQTKLHKKILILLDISKLHSHTTEARKRAVDWVMKAPFDKYAIFGGDIYLKYLAKFVIQATGRDDKMRHFDDKIEAINWLRS